MSCVCRIPCKERTQWIGLQTRAPKLTMLNPFTQAFSSSLNCTCISVGSFPCFLRRHSAYILADVLGRCLEFSSKLLKFVLNILPSFTGTMFHRYEVSTTELVLYPLTNSATINSWEGYAAALCLALSVAAVK